MSLVTWNGKLLLSPGGKLTLGPAADECCCVEDDTGVCCCDAMGDTLYMRIKQWECRPDCYNCGLTEYMLQVVYDVVLSAGDTDSIENAGCGWELEDISHDCLEEAWGGSWTGHYCTIGGVYTEREWYFALGCLKSNLNAPDLSFGICIGNSAFGGGAYATLGYTECPIDILHADSSLGLPFIELEIRRIPFAQW